jgi:hypothetical protein
MKQLFYKLTVVILLFSIALSSCTRGFMEMNTDPNNTPNALPQQLLAPALVNTVHANMIRNRNFNNELMQVTVDLSDADGRVFRYEYRANWSDYLYNAWYSQLTNFRDLYNIASNEVTYNRSYMGIALICQSWIFSLLTDTYGDVPYFQANMGKEKIYEPAFDAQKDIYFDIFKKLEEANEHLSAGTAIEVTSDPVYNGNVNRWRRFGNSLYLRLLMRISGKAEVADTVIKKFQEIVQNNSKYPIMANNDESAILRWTGVSPYTSPFLTVREQDWRAPAIASFFIDNLRTWNDPRIDLSTYAVNGVNRWGIAPYQGGFWGVPSGYEPGTNPVKMSYFYSDAQTVSGAPARSLRTDPLTGQMLNYAEVQFILAEAAAKGWISGSAENYYNKGVQASITLWIPQWNTPVTDYLSAADMSWNDSETLEEKMEKIHLQKYYALFCCDLQQWFEYRRTGHPVLPKGPGLGNGGVMPARMSYPVYVQSTNPTNYKAAVAAQGPDVISTPVWWQKP